MDNKHQYTAPVSYTHLDVYKRQVIEFQLKTPLIGCSQPFFGRPKRMEAKFYTLPITKYANETHFVTALCK